MLDEREELELRRAAARGDRGAQRRIAEMINAQELSGFDAAMVGAGRLIHRMGEGLGLAEPEGDVERSAYEALQRERPIATAMGESLPYMAGGLGAGAALRGAGLAANLAGQGGIAGLMGASQPGDWQERLAQGGIDAALGVAGEGVGRGVARMVGPGLRQRPGDLVGQAEELGYQVMPSSRAATPAPLRQSIEGGLESTPAGGIVMGKALEGNQGLYNRTVAEAIGEDADELTPSVLASARERIGGTFNQLMSADRMVPVTEQAIERIAELEDEAISPFIRGEADPIGTSLERLRKVLSGDAVSARDLMAQQSRLGKQGRQALRGENSNPELGHALLDIQELLLDMARGSMDEAEAAAFDAARAQYRTLSAVESGYVVNTATGDVSPARMAGYLRRRDRRGYLEGGNTSPLYVGTRFLGEAQPRLKSSGTAERSYLGRTLSGAGLGGGAGFAGSEDPEGVLGGAAIGAGLALAPAALARGYLSKPLSGWLSHEVGQGGRQALRAGAIEGAQGTYRAAQEPEDEIGQVPRQVAMQAIEQGINLARRVGAHSLERDLMLARKRGTPEEIERVNRQIGQVIKRATVAGELDTAAAWEKIFFATKLRPLNGEPPKPKEANNATD